MKNKCKVAIFSQKGSEALNIKSFIGEHFDALKDGMLCDSDNVRVLSGGAVASMLASRKVDIGAYESIEGVYTFCSDWDSEYETNTTPEWVYENICSAETLNYEKWHLVASRIMVKDIGMPPKNESGYRNILGAFSDGDKTYVFYDAYYNIIDERRQEEFKAIGSGLAYVFYSGNDGNYSGSIYVYSLSQIFLDVIDSDGNVETSLVSARLDNGKRISDSKYYRSMMVSTDKENYKYVSADYIPTLGQSYTAYFDRVYTEIYPVLDSECPSFVYTYPSPRRLVRYSNREKREAPFGDGGEKMLLLPDMRLLERTDGRWTLSEKSEKMPTLYAAVQYFDRLFGICGESLYASVLGECSNFTEATDNIPSSGGWQTVTGDDGGFTAITSFDGKVVVFTNNSMMTVRDTELPFTLSYVGDYGCISQEGLKAIGNSLYFVSTNGVMCYNGSSVKKISSALPQGIDYSMAKLTAALGMLILYLGDHGETWFYEESSGQWSRRRMSASELYFAGEGALIKEGKGYSFYRIFDEFGEFSFKIALSNSGRRKVKSISVTAKAGFDSELVLFCGEDALLGISYPEEQTVTRTYYPRMLYCDNVELSFAGYGDCTLYGIRIEYADVSNVARKIK